MPADCIIRPETLPVLQIAIAINPAPVALVKVKMSAVAHHLHRMELRASRHRVRTMFYRSRLQRDRVLEAAVAMVPEEPKAVTDALRTTTVFTNPPKRLLHVNRRDSLPRPEARLVKTLAAHKMETCQGSSRLQVKKGARYRLLARIVVRR